MGHAVVSMSYTTVLLLYLEHAGTWVALSSSNEHSTYGMQSYHGQLSLSLLIHQLLTHSLKLNLPQSQGSSSESSFNLTSSSKFSSTPVIRSCAHPRQSFHVEPWTPH